tara:strand:- start:1655 stop:1996 length:342 start_codon:yes stop_codon:yes gene_type:complete
MKLNKPIFFIMTILNVNSYNIDRLLKVKRLNQNVRIYKSIEECDTNKIETCSNLCSSCKGEKTILCECCHGTGFLMIGSEMIGTGNNCTYCSGKGEIECDECKGTGYIAKWMM